MSAYPPITETTTTAESDPNMPVLTLHEDIWNANLHLHWVPLPDVVFMDNMRERERWCRVPGILSLEFE
jgi:hypothetical protein